MQSPQPTIVDTPASPGSPDVAGRSPLLQGSSAPSAFTRRRTSSLSRSDSIDLAAVEASLPVLAPSAASSTSETSPVRARAAAFRHVSVSLDPIQLSIFSHRFMSIAEQMGRTLQVPSPLRVDCVCTYSLRDSMFGCFRL